MSAQGLISPQATSASLAPIRIGLVIGSARPDPHAAAVARWAANVARAHLASTAAAVELHTLDLAVFGLPPAAGRATEIAGLRPCPPCWADAVDACDGFVLVTPEHDQAPPPELEDALDFLFAEWHDKAAGLLGYGDAGAAGAIDRLRRTLCELRVADMHTAVELSFARDFAADAPTPDRRQQERLRRMLDEVVAWSRALRIVRLA